MQKKKKKSSRKQNIKKANKQHEIAIFNLVLQKTDPPCSTRLNVTDRRKEGNKGKGEEILR